MEGVENGDPTCDKDGQCTCKCDVTGRKCDVCEVGHQGFPDCHGKLRLYHFETFDIKSSFLTQKFLDSMKQQRNQLVAMKAGQK